MYLRRQDPLLLARARLAHVHGRVDAAVGQLAVEHQLHVAGALELLKDEVVHARAGLDQRGGHDGEGATLVKDAGAAEKAARRVHGPAVDAAAHGSAAVADAFVVGTR